MTKMQLKDSERFPGELLLLAVLCQMLGSYHCYAKLIMPFTVIAFALPFTVKWIGKGASKSKFASRSQTSKPSAPANVKVTTSKKAVSEAPKPRIDVVETAAKVETVPKKAESPKGAAEKEQNRVSEKEIVSSEEKTMHSKDKMQKKRQRSRNTSTAEALETKQNVTCQEKTETSPEPAAPVAAETKQTVSRKGKAAFSPCAVDVIMTMVKEPSSEPVACAPTSQKTIQKPTRKSAQTNVATPAPAPAPPAAAAPSTSQQHVDWVEYWNEGRSVAPATPENSTKSKSEIAIQTEASAIKEEVGPEKPKQAKKTEQAEIEKVTLKESLSRLPSLGLAENAQVTTPTPPPCYAPPASKEHKKEKTGKGLKPRTPAPTHVPELPKKAAETDLAAKFEEEARRLEEEAQRLEEEAMRYLEQANQKTAEVKEEVLAALSGSESDSDEKKISRASSAARWADIEEDQWDDEAAFAIMGDMGMGDSDNGPRVCADFLNFGSCPRGAACPWQHANANEDDESEDLQKKEEEILYKRGMLYPSRSPSETLQAVN